MKRLTFISVLIVIACIAVNTFAADFYVIPSLKKNYAPVANSGETVSYATGCDGNLGKGVAWPNPRFTKNVDGTVKDNLTGLVWLQNANCSGATDWVHAIDFCNTLEDGDCGLTDGSSAGNWRLPNLFELESLRHMAYYNPAISNAEGTAKWTEGNPFSGVVSDDYWSSTTVASETPYALVVYMGNGTVNYNDKDGNTYVWPVRSDN